MNFAFVSGTHFAIYNGNMSRTSSSSHRFPKRLALLASLALGSALALGAGCTFEPPGSVLGGGGGGGGGGADGGDEADADIGGDETMTITFTSEPTAGLAVPNFAPANLVATWIEDSNGAFVQTVDRQLSNNYARYLLGWAAMSGGIATDQDAVTGATRPNHNTPITATWSIPAELPDGIYTIRVETTDGNANSAEQNTQGTFTFEKNGTASTQTPVGLGYSNVTLDYSGRL